MDIVHGCGTRLLAIISAKIIATFVMKTFLDTGLLKNIKLEHKKTKRLIKDFKTSNFIKYKNLLVFYITFIYGIIIDNGLR